MAAELFLLLLPSGHVLLFTIVGAVATGADAALGAFLVLWFADLALRSDLRRGLLRVVRGERVERLPPRRYLLGIGLLLAFAAWVAVSGRWGPNGEYALVKGLGTGALGLGAAALATSGIGWRQATLAWLGGAALAMVLTVVLALGSPAMAARAYYGGAGAQGMPFLRLSGPFSHPTLFGDYLVVSLILLWSVWPEVKARFHRLGIALAVALAGTLALTASTALIGGGVAAFVLGRRAARGGAWLAGRALQAVGAAVSVVTFLGVMLNLEIHVNGLDVMTAGIRPAIWRSSLSIVAANPLLGVGASPVLARVADPLQGGALVLRDAHDAYLSVWGQFGLVGLVLAAGGMVLAVGGALEVLPRSRVRTAVGVAFLAVAVNAFFAASEGVRHLWVLLGMAGVAAGMGWSASDPPAQGAPVSSRPSA
jgi:O-antigen ligase